MRNLKKVLSLALALVMLLGMMVVGSSAAVVAYADSDKVTKTEAVEVMSGIGVFNGEGAGFNPQGGLNREMAAAIIARMRLGAAAYALTTAEQIFPDVVPGVNWSAPYITYCVSQGIITGRDNGCFDPWASVTGTEFAKMLLTALGYNAITQGYIGSGWDVNVQRDAYLAGLTNGVGVANMNLALTREQAAQMALNTEKANVVYQSAPIYANGVYIPGGKPETYAQTTGTDYAGDTVRTGTKTGATIQFCEMYCPDLALSTANKTDAFGRPSNEWTYGTGNVISNAANAEPIATFNTNKTNVTADLAGYTVKTGGATVNALGSYTMAITSNADIATATANGRIVEVYATGTEIDTVVIITKSVFELNAAPVVSDGKVTIASMGIVSADVADVKGYEGLAKGDVVLSVKDQDGVWHIEKATCLPSVTVTGYTGTSALIGGQLYKPSALNTGAYDGSTAGKKVADTKEYNVYLDNAGCIVLAKLASQATAQVGQLAVVNQVAWVQPETDHSIGSSADPYIQARLVFMDGTEKVVPVGSVDGFELVVADTASSTLFADDKVVDTTNGKDYSFTTGADRDTLATNSGSGKTTTVTAAATKLAKDQFYNFYQQAGGATPDATKLAGKFFVLESLTDNAKALASLAKLIPTGKFYSWTEKDGVYTLTQPTAAQGANTPLGTTAKVETGKPVIAGTSGVIGNANTVFIYASGDAGAQTFKTYTGIANVPTTAQNTTATDTALVLNGVATHVYVNLAKKGLEGTPSTDMVYIIGNSVITTTANPATYVVDVLLNGAPTTLTVKANPSGDIGKVIPVKTVKDGVYELDTASAKTVMAGIGNVVGNTLLITDTNKDGTHTDATAYTYANGAVAYVIDDATGKKVATTTTIEALTLDGNDKITVITDPSSSTVAVAAYVTKVSNEPSVVTLAAGGSNGATVGTGTLAAADGVVTGWVSGTADQLQITTVTVANNTSIKSISVDGATVTQDTDFTTTKGEHTVVIVIEDGNGGPDTTCTYKFTVS